MTITTYIPVTKEHTEDQEMKVRLVEFIEYHLMLGVEHITLYSHTNLDFGLLLAYPPHLVSYFNNWPEVCSCFGNHFITIINDCRVWLIRNWPTTIVCFETKDVHCGLVHGIQMST